MIAMNENEIFDKLSAIQAPPQFSLTYGEDSERLMKVAEHKMWLEGVRKERPSPAKQYKIGVYIRFFNQTKYEDYLDFHKKQFTDTIALCPNWTLVDFYVDEGASPPNMETAKEWSRLVQDAWDDKVDLIITQKIGNVSKKRHEVIMFSRIMAALKKPIGIYFISEDIFNLASYYQEDLRDTFFVPPGWEQLPDEAIDLRGLPEGND